MTDDQDHPLADLMPTDPLMVGPWLVCLQFTLSRDDFFEAFQRDFGRYWEHGTAEQGERGFRELAAVQIAGHDSSFSDPQHHVTLI